MPGKPIPEIFGMDAYRNTKDVLFGLECEIEAVRGWEDSLGNWWGVHEDGSLRNNGREFVSPPSPRTQVVEKFKELHKGIRLGKDPFSERTSIHVHVNMQNLTDVEVRHIILLYALYEEYFFMMTVPARRENIHCVPLNQTFLPTYYGAAMANIPGRWQKYTAMNAKPLSNYGTLEFRHMHGHNDPGLLNDWLYLLEKLVILGTKKDKPDPSWFKKEIMEEDFKFLFGHLPQFPQWKEKLSQNTFNPTLDIKLALFVQ